MDFLESGLLTIQRTLEAMGYFGGVIMMLLIGKGIFNRTTSYDFDTELTEKDNPAFAVSLAGYLIGLAIALSGCLQATGQGLWVDMASIGVSGIIAIIFMRLTVMINDKFILYKFLNEKEIIQDMNVGTGFVQAGSCIAAGFMLCGVMSGQSLSFVDRIIDISIYWAIGQAILVFSGLVFQWITPYDIHAVLENDDNAAAGLSFGGFLVSVGLIANAALRGATSNILAEIPTIAIWTLFGLLLLAVMRVITDLVFLPKSKLSDEIVRDRNIGAGAIAAIGFLCIALLFSTAVNPSAPTKSNLFETNEQTSEPVKEISAPQSIAPLRGLSDHRMPTPKM